MFVCKDLGVNKAVFEIVSLLVSLVNIKRIKGSKQNDKSWWGILPYSFTEAEFLNIKSESDLS